MDLEIIQFCKSVLLAATRTETGGDILVRLCVWMRSVYML